MISVMCDTHLKNIHSSTTLLTIQVTILLAQKIQALRHVIQNLIKLSNIIGRDVGIHMTISKIINSEKSKHP